MQLPTAGLLIINNRKLLLAFSKNKQCFYLPGGKVDDEESTTRALCREIAEELNIEIQEHELEYYTHISAPAYGEKPGTIMEQDCFLIDKPVVAEASAEIGEIKYFSQAEYQQEATIAPGVIMILELLKEDNLID